MKPERFMGNSLKNRIFPIQKNSKQPELDYKVYRFSAKEGMLYVLLIIGAMVGVSYLFYRSLWGLVVVSPMGLYFWKSIKEDECKKRKAKLAVQFKDCIKSVSASMKAGYSVENAFRESIKDINLVYGEDSLMSAELRSIISGLSNNVTLEEKLISLGERSGIEDIREFGEIFKIAKRGGGNLTEIISDTVSLMDRKSEIDAEIDVLISSRRTESRIMEAVPFAIIVYISATSPGFFESLYHNFLGIVIMTICLGAYFGAVVLSKKIVSIEV